MTAAPMDLTLRLHPLDDVLVAKALLPAGTVVETDDGPVTLKAQIPAGHKIAARARKSGDPVRRYGQVIGFASTAIAPGDRVHVHNLHMGEVSQDYGIGSDLRPSKLAGPEELRTFDGFLRADGRVGTRNYVAIVSTVNCSASVSKLARDRFRDVQRVFPNVDGVLAFTHRGGCGLINSGEDHRMLERVLGNMASHPNIAAYVIVGLGCEVNQPLTFIKHRALVQDGKAPPVVGIQDSGGVRKSVEAVVEQVAKLLPKANEAQRTKQPISELVLGTNCGGSDGHSGITANPALGWAADELIRHGGSAILGETTEIYGAEQLLTRRAIDPEVAHKLLRRIDWWRAHLQSHGADVDHNPSPGNLAGGISTVLEKSLGGVAKGGTTPLVDVVEYGERSQRRGFIFMDTPGYDPVSVTGIVAGGANLMAFTTGRGSVLGFKPTPSLKLASNSETYRRMQDDMDLDCGPILNGSSIGEIGRQVFEELLQVASGKKTKSEELGLGDEEFDPWMPGPTL
ncbi:MAG TPA: altronate dehydratase family protein [Myxococcales bacterium]|nr:altronate dehydratase family protein [Myxococcales bacterium]